MPPAAKGKNTYDSQKERDVTESEEKPTKRMGIIYCCYTPLHQKGTMGTNHYLTKRHDTRKDQISNKYGNIQGQ
jgi:hypothetical protein